MLGVLTTRDIKAMGREQKGTGGITIRYKEDVPSSLGRIRFKTVLARGGSDRAWAKESSSTEELMEIIRMHQDDSESEGG